MDLKFLKSYFDSLATTMGLSPVARISILYNGPKIEVSLMFKRINDNATALKMWESDKVIFEGETLSFQKGEDCVF